MERIIWVCFLCLGWLGLSRCFPFLPSALCGKAAALVFFHVFGKRGAEMYCALCGLERCISVKSVCSATARKLPLVNTINKQTGISERCELVSASGAVMVKHCAGHRPNSAP